MHLARSLKMLNNRRFRQDSAAGIRNRKILLYAINYSAFEYIDFRKKVKQTIKAPSIMCLPSASSVLM